MPTSQVRRPLFSLVLSSDHGKTFLRDYQRAQNRNVQIPVYGPANLLTQTIGIHHAVGFLTYKCDYMIGRRSIETQAQDDYTSGESGDSSGEPALVPDGSFWSRLKSFFSFDTLFGTQLPGGPDYGPMAY